MGRRVFSEEKALLLRHPLTARPQTVSAEARRPSCQRRPHTGLLDEGFKALHQEGLEGFKNGAEKATHLVPLRSAVCWPQSAGLVCRDTRPA